MDLLSANLILGAFLFVLYMGYMWILPRPILGIPYNQKVAKNVLGDSPALIKHG